LNNLSGQLGDLRGQLDMARRDMDALQRENSMLKRQLADGNGLNQQLQDRANGLSNRLQQCDVAFADMERANQNLTRRLGMLDNALAAKNNECFDLAAQLEKMRQDNSYLLGELNVINAKNMKLTADFNNLRDLMMRFFSLSKDVVNRLQVMALETDDQITKEIIIKMREDERVKDQQPEVRIQEQQLQSPQSQYYQWKQPTQQLGKNNTWYY
jgi:chromosome segregation ATPase